MKVGSLAAVLLLFGLLFLVSSCASGAKKAKMSKQYTVGTMSSPEGLIVCPRCERRYMIEFEQ